MQWGWYAFLETLHHKTRLNVLTCYMTAGVPDANEKKKKKTQRAPGSKMFRMWWRIGATPISHSKYWPRSGQGRRGKSLLAHAY